MTFYVALRRYFKEKIPGFIYQVESCSCSHFNEYNILFSLIPQIQYSFKTIFNVWQLKQCVRRNDEIKLQLNNTRIIIKNS